MTKQPDMLKQLLDIIDPNGSILHGVDPLQACNVPLYEQICQHQLLGLTDDSPLKSLDDIIKDFHAHLDECVQCRNNPMGLCPLGATLLKRVSHPAVSEPM